jgi:hypothetical protein
MAAQECRRNRLGGNQGSGGRRARRHSDLARHSFGDCESLDNYPNSGSCLLMHAEDLPAPIGSLPASRRRAPSYRRDCRSPRQNQTQCGGVVAAAAFSLRRRRVVHSPTTRREPLKPRACRRRQSSAPFRQPSVFVTEVSDEKSVAAGAKFLELSAQPSDSWHGVV